MSILSDRLKQSRLSVHLSQEQVVQSCKGIESKQVLSNYENGRREPSIAILCELASLYMVSLDYLGGLCQESNPTLQQAAKDTGIIQEFFWFSESIKGFGPFINAIFSSDEMSDIFREGYLLQNMVERIHTTQEYASATESSYLPDDNETVRVPTADFFSYHSQIIGSYIAKALSKWCMNRIKE